MNLNDITAVKIKEYRERKNLSQSAFAKQVNMSSSAYSRLENGEIQITLNTLEKIAEKLNTPIFELLDFKSTQVNHFNNNSIGQTNNSTININLTPKEFQAMYEKLQEEGKV